jgi:ubiquinone biosynthesis protein UbiJ
LVENFAEFLSEETNTLATAPALASLSQERALTLAQLAQIDQRHAALQARLSRLTSRLGTSI